MDQNERVIVSPLVKHITRPIRLKEVKTIEIGPEHSLEEFDQLPNQEDGPLSSSTDQQQDPHFNTNYYKYGHIAMTIIIVIMILSFWLIVYQGTRSTDIVQVYSAVQTSIILVLVSLVWAALGYNFYYISKSLDDPHRITWGTVLVFLYIMEAWYFFEGWHRPNLQALFQFRIGITLYVAAVGLGTNYFIPEGNMILLMYLVYCIFILVITGFSWLSLPQSSS